MPLGKASLLTANIQKPELWSDEDPALYTCEITLHHNGQEQKAIERFGFRHFEFVEKGPFRLNGSRLLLRGTHRHEDHAGVGAAMTEEQMRAEMTLMKEMGVNFMGRDSLVPRRSGWRAVSGTSQTNVDEHDSYAL